MDRVKPPRLRPGNLIGVIAPASPVLSRAKVERGIRYLEALGYSVMPGRHLETRHGLLAGTDAQRAEDFNRMFRCPEVKAVFCLRGGYGSGRILPLIDYAAVRRQPKIFVGFSDLTALQLALLRRTGLITFSGPLVAVEFAQGPSRFTEEQFWKLLTSARPTRRFPAPPGLPLRTLQRGVAQGPLIPTNLALLLSLFGTPYLPDLKQGILVLEDVGEPPHRLDRMLTQLRLAGTLNKISGLAFGQFDRPPSSSSTPSNCSSLLDLLPDAATHVNVPVVANLPYGHVPDRLTLPLGCQAKLNADRRTLSLVESAVS